MGPVKGHGEEAKARGDAKQVCNNDALGRKPSNDVEVAESGHQEARQEIKGGGAGPDNVEELPAAYGPAVGRLVLLPVEGGKHGGGHESAGPDHAAGANQEAASHACEAVAEDLRGYRQEQLVDNGRLLVVELRLLDDDIRGKGEAKGHIAAHIDARVLLFVPPALGEPQTQRVEELSLAMAVMAMRRDGGPDAIGELLFRVVRPLQQIVPQVAQRMDEQQRDDGSNGNAGVSQGKKQIGGGAEDGEEDGQAPHARRVYGQRRVVDWGHRSPHGFIGRVLLGLSVRHLGRGRGAVVQQRPVLGDVIIEHDA